MELAITLYRFIFCRPLFYKFNEHMYKLSLRGIGVLNSEGNDITGENYFLSRLQRTGKIKVIVDVGSNTETYGVDFFPDASIYAFEPHPLTFQKFLQNPKNHKVKGFNLGVSDHSGTAQLWDFSQNAERKALQPTSQLSSLHKEVIEKVHHQPAQAYKVQLITIDEFMKKEKLSHIDLLKIDTEGNEFAVLQGAKTTIKNQQIDIIQFEFNEMNVITRSFLRDFMELLPNHDFYRLMPRGLFPLSHYRPVTHEIFGFQNIVAIPKKGLAKTRS